MKKHIFLAFILVMAFCMLVGCNKSNSTTATQNRSTSGGNNTQVENNVPVPTTNTVAGYLAQFGLSEDDIKPEGFISFEGPEGWLIKINAGAGQFDAWSKKVFDKITAISTDRKVYEQGYPALGDDEAKWSAGILMFQWAYPYNGKVVNLDVSPGDTGTYRFSIHF